MRSNQIFALGGTALSTGFVIITGLVPPMQAFYALVLGLFLAGFFCLLVQPRETPTMGYAFGTLVVSTFVAFCFASLVRDIYWAAAFLLFFSMCSFAVACVAFGVVAYFREHPELHRA